MASTSKVDDDGTRSNFALYGRNDKFEPELTIHTDNRTEWEYRILNYGDVERVDFASLDLSSQCDIFFNDCESIRSLICALIELEAKLAKAQAVPQKYADPVASVQDAADEASAP